MAFSRPAAAASFPPIHALGAPSGNCRARFHTALGSAREVRSGLQLAVAWGHVEPQAVVPVEELLDRVCAMLWRLARGRK